MDVEIVKIVWKIDSAWGPRCSFVASMTLCVKQQSSFWRTKPQHTMVSFKSKKVPTYWGRGRDQMKMIVNNSFCAFKCLILVSFWTLLGSSKLRSEKKKAFEIRVCVFMNFWPDHCVLFYSAGFIQGLLTSVSLNSQLHFSHY